MGAILVSIAVPFICPSWSPLKEKLFFIRYIPRGKNTNLTAQKSIYNTGLIFRDIFNI
jgi:hypothetical protein